MRQLIVFKHADLARHFGFRLAHEKGGVHFAPSEGLSVLRYDDGGVIEMISTSYDAWRLQGRTYDFVTYDHGVVLDDKTRFEIESRIR